MLSSIPHHDAAAAAPPLPRQIKTVTARRASDDGNIVVATGPKPPSPAVVSAETAAGAGATATTLWQSGPLRSDPGGKSPGGRGGSDACKKCQVRVGKDGRVVLVREREELAAFSPLWAEAFFEVLPPIDKR